MFERGDWITPTLGGHNWFEKPALLFWLEIASFSIFGVSEWSARIGPAIFGLGTVAGLWLLGKSYSKTEGQKPHTDFGNWLALIAASTLGIIVFSRGASFDIMVTFPMTAALVSFFFYDRSGKFIPLMSFYFFIGVAVLAKGLIGIVFPYAIVVFYFVLSRRIPSRSLFVSSFWGTLLAAAVAAVWYVPMYLRHGWEFVDEFFLQHHFQRFTSNKYQHPQPFYFFFWVLPLMTLPWMPLFAAAVWKSVRSISHSPSRPLACPSCPLLLFSFSWLLVPLVFFSLSGSKLPGYILPAVPPAAIITALFISKLIEQRRWRIGVAAIATATLLTTIILLATVVPRFAEYDSVKSLIAAGDERGLSSSRVLTLHTISHNAEFYAARRLLRDENGKQEKLFGATEIASIIANEGGKSVLVLVPIEYQHQLTNAAQLKSEVLKNNGELAIVAVSVK
jgi:4-amino-4-deoxy-L-arabinose transferase-like glycosyltransferase